LQKNNFSDPADAGESDDERLYAERLQLLDEILNEADKFRQVDEIKKNSSKARELSLTTAGEEVRRQAMQHQSVDVDSEDQLESDDKVCNSEYEDDETSTLRDRDGNAVAQQSGSGKRNLSRKRRDQSRESSGGSSVDPVTSALDFFKSLGGSVGKRTDIDTKRLEIEENRARIEVETQAKRLKLEEERSMRESKMETRRLDLEERRLLLEETNHQNQGSLKETLEGIESVLKTFARGQSQQLEMLETQGEAISKQKDVLMALVLEMKRSRAGS
jgi:hypothetical protein